MNKKKKRRISRDVEGLYRIPTGILKLELKARKADKAFNTLAKSHREVVGLKPPPKTR